jgi:streptomycin 6-kinase
MGRTPPDLRFDRVLARWRLTRDGLPKITRSSTLLPVRRDGKPLMLKIAQEPEERWGCQLMVWWNGDGAARVHEHEDGVLLLERAIGERCLAEMARMGQDDAASRIIYSVAAQLHAPRDRPWPELVPLTRWFEALEPVAATLGGILARAAGLTRELLSSPQDTTVLHGDLHHQNVLDFGPRGWLAIDPKCLVGERAFDFVNILRNPDFEIATAPGRLGRQAHVLAEAAGLDREGLLKWTLAFAGLSAAWIIGDGDEPTLDLAVAELAAGELAAASPSNSHLCRNG